jgi:hypothetical protein
MHDNFWWLGCVLSISEESNDMKISSLHPHGPPASYIYLAKTDILGLPQSEILAKVSPNTAIGCAHILTSEEITVTAERNNTYICKFH